MTIRFISATCFGALAGLWLASSTTALQAFIPRPERPMWSIRAITMLLSKNADVDAASPCRADDPLCCL